MFVVAADLIAAFGAILAKSVERAQRRGGRHLRVGASCRPRGRHRQCRDRRARRADRGRGGGPLRRAQLQRRARRAHRRATVGCRRREGERPRRVHVDATTDTLELDQIADSLPGTVLTIDRSTRSTSSSRTRPSEERRLRIYGGTVETDVNGTPVSEVDRVLHPGDRRTATRQLLTFDAVAAVRVRRRSVLRRGSRRRRRSHRDRGAVIHQEPLYQRAGRT